MINGIEDMLTCEIIERDKEIARLRCAMKADDDRLLSAGQRVGIVAGCDTPDLMADEIQHLRADLELAKQVRDEHVDVTRACNAEIEGLRAELAEVRGDLEMATSNWVRCIEERDSARERCEEARHLLDELYGCVDRYLYEPVSLCDAVFGNATQNTLHPEYMQDPNLLTNRIRKWLGGKP